MMIMYSESRDNLCSKFCPALFLCQAVNIDTMVIHIIVGWYLLGNMPIIVMQCDSRSLPEKITIVVLCETRCFKLSHAAHQVVEKILNTTFF